jgi:ATP-binding cassette subfamily C (CFTR/MRP) protein 4
MPLSSVGGGQRARIGLARVLYRDVDLVLLDDPLSAVDSRVARLIFRSAIQGLCISKGKCVVLATHQYQLIGEETCVLMKRGNVIQVAPYGDCVGRSGDQKLVRDSMKRKSRELASLSPDNWKHEASINLPRVGDPYESADSSQRETKDSGAVSWNTWRDYVSAMGGKWVVLSMLVLFLFTQGWLLTTITYIGIWAEKPFQEQRSFSFLLLIGLLGLSAVGLSMVRSTIGFFLTLRASRNLHDNMTFAVLRSKIVFFDTNPLGRILNRFSADVGSNDDQLSSSLNDTFAIGFMVIGAVVTAAVVMPFLLITIPPIFFYFYRTRRMFITSSRELKRLEGIARSPLYAMMSESIKGISSIRANGATKYFQQRFAVVQNAHSRAFFSFISLTRWLNFRLEAIQILLIGTASLLAVLFSTNGWLNVGPSTLGLALTLLMQLSGLLQWAIRQSSEVINQMVSVERVAAFTKLEPEPPLETERDIQIGEWPSSGSMNVHDLTVRYRDDLPPALSKFSFKIDGGMRVGVVGRTGGGKSTLLQSIFRLLQAETGVITVDHIDISSLGLHKLRKSMSVIPQTPVLFSGWTLRDNLDPFGKHDNSEILDVIASVQMQNVCEDLPAGLNTIVAENGSNFSVGQRQLFCVARAILQKNKIVVLDEPTANVDNKTDVMLQRAVATSFPGATVIAIAHRLDTIIDYDRIIVVGNGKMLECGTPYELLCKSNGHFAAMVTETGEATAAELRERAIVKALSGNGHKQVAIY